MWYVYILRGINNQFYKGMTNNLKKRLRQHQLGQHIATKRMIPFTLVHVEICTTRTEARELEKFFKTGFGREVICEIVV